MKTTFFRWFIAILALTTIDIQFIYSNSDSTEIRIHFLHGSRPKRQFKKTEQRWFGGILGGHAGVETNTNTILNFLPSSTVHVFNSKKEINSRFAVHDTLSFYRILGGNWTTNKKTIITLKISAKQKIKLDSVALAYLTKSNYDYAFFGMRCGAAAYDILAQVGIVHKYSFKRTWRKFFYPRKVRRYLERYAKSNGFKIIKQKGSNKRKWERD